MEQPFCFSNFFVNKQNVRSIKNVLNFKLMKKKEPSDFFLSILEDTFIISELSSDFLNLLLTLRVNVRNCCKQDFKNYFPINEETGVDVTYKITPVPKEEIFAGCWIALLEIIPKNLLGSHKNMKILQNIVRVILFSMKSQHIFLNKLINKWDYRKEPWNMISTVYANQVLCKILSWILKNVLSAVICLNFFVTTCKIDANENMLYFFWKNEWQSFYDKKISDMIYSKVISRFLENRIGNIIKFKYSPQERHHLKVGNKDVPKLHLVLKPNNNYRPIAYYKNNSITSSEKLKIKNRLDFLKVLAGKADEKIETKYASLYSTWVTLNQPKLFFVKTDLSNAFGSINRAKLLKILSERHLHFQKRQKSPSLKKKFAQIYKELITELRKPLLVRAGTTVYLWQEGLVQGYKYSPALSELYYTYMDELFFSEHQEMSESKLKLFTRVVDDYMYITDTIEDAQSFLNALSNYKNINYEKTVVNFPHLNIKQSNEITFLGYVYNTTTLQVKRESYIYSGPMCYKITFSSAISDLTKFLENRIGQSGIKVNSHLFNLYYNNEELIWNHVFLTLCLSANKFCTIFGILCNGNDMQKVFNLYKKRVTIKLCDAMIDTLMQNKPKEYLFMYCINHFRYLSFKALGLCAKGTPKGNWLIPLIKINLAKTNCIFGKFKEHAGRIDRSGKPLCPAIKEVCRRTDLRKIMKQFEILPEGFECYNHKKFLNISS